MKNVLVIGPCPADIKSLRNSLKSNYSLNLVEVKNTFQVKSALESNDFEFLLVSRVIHGDPKKGVKLVKEAKQISPQTKVFFLSRFSDAQDEALAAGADAAFDIDLLIGYIRPSMKNIYEKISSKLTNFISTNKK